MQKIHQKKFKKPELATTVTVRYGSEGPVHDPYGYQEIEVTRHGHRIVGHFGLACWVEYDGEKIKEDEEGDKMHGLHDYPQLYTDYDTKAFRLFEKMTGFHPALWVRWERKLEERKRSKCKCGSRKFEFQSGYPGEHLQICAKCDQIVYCEFHESEII